MIDLACFGFEPLEVVAVLHVPIVSPAHVVLPVPAAAVRYLLVAELLLVVWIPTIAVVLHFDSAAGLSPTSHDSGQCQHGRDPYLAVLKVHLLSDVVADPLGLALDHLGVVDPCRVHSQRSGFVAWAESVRPFDFAPPTWLVARTTAQTVTNERGKIW